MKCEWWVVGPSGRRGPVNRCGHHATWTADSGTSYYCNRHAMAAGYFDRDSAKPQPIKPEDEL